MNFIKSLRFRLILLVLMAVIPALGVTLFTGLEQRRLARINAEEDALRLARVVANQQTSLIEGARQLLLALSLTPAIQGGDQAECSNYLASLAALYPQYSVIYVANTNGTIACSSLAVDYQLNFSDRSYFQETLRTKDFVVGETLVSRFTGEVIMPFAMPVQDGSGNVTQVLAVSLDMKLLSTAVQELRLPPDSVMLMVEDDGTILTRFPEGDNFVGMEFQSAPVVQQILANPAEGRAEVAGLDGVLRFYGFTPVDSPGNHFIKVSIGIPVNVAYLAADRGLWNNLYWIGLIGLLALAVAWFGGDVLFLRVVSLTAERDVAEAKLREANQQLEVRVIERTAELDLVNKQLSYELEERQKVVQQLSEREIELEKMLLVIERSNRELESFAYITSHDLQEPLRKIQAFGDRLSRRYQGELGEEGAAFVSRMVSAANRMQLMINDLLDYSRVTTRSGAFVQVDLNQVAHEVISDLEVRIAETGAQVHVSDLPTIRADALQMRQLLQNLVSNSIKFHRPGVPPVVHIGCEASPQDGNNRKIAVFHIYIEDNGIGFDEKYLDRIFLPFQRLYGQDVYEGSGIGLAICRKIAERHGGSISANSTPGSGSRFIVKLPSSSLFTQGEKHAA